MRSTFDHAGSAQSAQPGPKKTPRACSSPASQKRNHAVIAPRKPPPSPAGVKWVAPASSP
ncbi:hypothetical protein [Amycolatopsis tolypomycina]|uniref:hypothetical protein n=1 Tax=Amycolatopsis tolypomycina TaxID=208445 RepID=UPI0033A14082